VADLSKSLNMNYRNIYSAIEFHKQYPDTNTLPEGYLRDFIIKVKDIYFNRLERLLSIVLEFIDQNRKFLDTIEYTMKNIRVKR
jgi:hypothetical protein